MKKIFLLFVLSILLTACSPAVQKARISTPEAVVSQLESDLNSKVSTDYLFWTNSELGNMNPAGKQYARSKADFDKAYDYMAATRKTVFAALAADGNVKIAYLNNPSTGNPGFGPIKDNEVSAILNFTSNKQTAIATASILKSNGWKFDAMLISAIASKELNLKDWSVGHEMIVVLGGNQTFSSMEVFFGDSSLCKGVPKSESGRISLSCPALSNAKPGKYKINLDQFTIQLFEY